jgi:hypothetical protein
MHEERVQLLAQRESTSHQMQTLNKTIEKTTDGFEAQKNEWERSQPSVAEQMKSLDLAESQNQLIEKLFTIGNYQLSHRHKSGEKETVELGESVETQCHVFEKSKAETDNYGDLESQENVKETRASKESSRNPKCILITV